MMLLVAEILMMPGWWDLDEVLGGAFGGGDLLDVLGGWAGTI